MPAAVDTGGLPVSLLVVTSPAPSNPSTVLLQASLDSTLSCLPELSPATTPLLIVMDGYTIAGRARTKRGFIGQDMVAPYEELASKLPGLCERLGFKDYRIVRLPTHHGFALAVKRGLELCATPFCLVCQHDRVFRNSFRGLRDVLAAMQREQHVRYVGFPTVTSSSHASQLQHRYYVNCLNDEDVRIRLHSSVEAGALLQPCIFWFDSQHLAHVQRYLEIYDPFVNMPDDMKYPLGWKFVKDMVLRQGDFIEDKFGQMQRRAFIDLASQKAPSTKVKEWFKWFGCYLLWVPPPVGDPRQAEWGADVASLISEEVGEGGWVKTSKPRTWWEREQQQSLKRAGSAQQQQPGQAAVQVDAGSRQADDASSQCEDRSEATGASEATVSRGAGALGRSSMNGASSSRGGDGSSLQDGASQSMQVARSAAGQVCTGLSAGLASESRLGSAPGPRLGSESGSGPVPGPGPGSGLGPGPESGSGSGPGSGVGSDSPMDDDEASCCSSSAPSLPVDPGPDQSTWLGCGKQVQMTQVAGAGGGGLIGTGSGAAGDGEAGPEADEQAVRGTGSEATAEARTEAGAGAEVAEASPETGLGSNNGRGPHWTAKVFVSHLRGRKFDFDKSGAQHRQRNAHVPPSGGSGLTRDEEEEQAAQLLALLEL